MKEFINQTKRDIIDNKIGDNYCILVSRTTAFDTKVRFVYKNIEEFEKKIDSDVKNINSIFGVEFELWVFD